MNILEWGCRTGEALTHLTREYGDRINAYGFSIESHPEWKKNNHVKFIWNDPFRLLQYMKKGSMDLIYSRFGLFLFFPMMNGIHPNDPPTTNARVAVDYLHHLGERLNKGGILVTHVPDGLIGAISRYDWKAHGFKMRIRGRFNYISKKRTRADSVPPRVIIERVA